MLKQNLTFKLNQKLSPQQIKLMKLIQLPTLDFEQRIKNEIEIMVSSNSMPKKVEEVWKKFQKIKNPNYMDGHKVWEFLMPYLWKKALFKD